MIIQRVLPHYRLPFFDRLYRRLAEFGIDLVVKYGMEREGTVPRTVQTSAVWAHQIRNRYFRCRGSEVVWQTGSLGYKGTDLIIIEQSSRLLLNYVLQLQRACTALKVAFWGHGRNLQAVDPESLIERSKRLGMNYVDWWFAYTDLTRKLLVAGGYPVERICLVNNTIDTSDFGDSADGEGVPTDETGPHAVRTGNVALYCGGLVPEKRIGFMLQACALVRRQIPDFELLIVGDGPEEARVRDFAALNPWVHYAGPKFGRDRVPYFRCAQALLIAGPLGLAIVDSFAAGTPLIGVNLAGHGPEIDYLVSGENGLLCADSVEHYARAIVGYLLDPALRSRLRNGAKASALKYSLENMVESFAIGVQSCLAAPAHRLGRC